MGGKKKINRGMCGARTINGQCIPMGGPCTSVGDSICSPVQEAFALGVHAMELKSNGKMIHIFGLCPFCQGRPISNKPNWFELVILHKGPKVICSKCGAELVSVNKVFTSKDMAIHLPE